jgi:hypothetical protein
MRFNNFSKAKTGVLFDILHIAVRSINSLELSIEVQFMFLSNTECEKFSTARRVQVLNN